MSNAPSSPGYFPSKDESSHSFTRSGSTTSTLLMMIPIPHKNQNLLPLPLADSNNLCGKDDEKTKLQHFEFPVALPNSDTKVDPLSYQSYLNHPFTQHRQQKFQEQQTHQPKPHQTYASKYTSYTNSSQTRVRVSASAYHKPSTTSALSLIEKEKMTFQYQSHRDSMISPPPPPYLHSDHGPNTPFSAKSNKRNSLPVSASSSSPTVAAARTARELKRHSLPVTPSPASGVQWPSAMTMTVAAVTRPKLARTLPPQAIALFYPSGGELRSPSPLSAVTPTAVFTPRSASRLLDRSETETLYSMSDSFLEPHHPSPPPNLKSQFQHQYYRSSASMSHPLSPPRRFAEGYCPHAESRSQSPSPEYRQSWQTQQSQKTLGGGSNRQSQAMQRQNSASSVASSETVSSSSTTSEAQCNPPKDASVPPAVKSLVADPVSEPAIQAPPTPGSPTLESAMMPPPPAYVSRKCEETLMTAESDASGNAETAVRETLSEKARLSVALPEIASMGNLSSEFSIDFGTFQY
ncbi:hypothetical protein BGZ75_003800 [Mortierella antarctica]|nr:hypothetical protein BGZ75_003800 [Mortierella antarctica]